MVSTGSGNAERHCTMTLFMFCWRFRAKWTNPIFRDEFILKNFHLMKRISVNE